MRLPAPVSFLAAAALLALGLSAPAAGAKPPARILDLPREGFSVQVDPAWAVSQPREALLELRRGRATLWVRRDLGSADDPLARLGALAERHGAAASQPTPWSVAGAGPAARLSFDAEGQRHGFALVSQPRGLRLELEWVLPAGDPALGAALEAVLATLDVTPYEASLRFVDLAAGWSLDVPHGWERDLDADGRTLFRAPGAPQTLLALRRAVPAGGVPGAAPAPDAFEAEVGDLWTKALGRKTPPLRRPVEAPAPTGATRHGAWLLGEAGATEGVASTQERLGWWLSVLARDGAEETALEAAAACTSFRAPAEPGPRAAPGGPPAVLLGEPEGFGAPGAPAVTFRLPRGWTAGTPSSSMRLAQWRLPAEDPAGEPVDCVVFFFGAGGGGSVEANLERWKRQFEVEGEAAQGVEEVAPGLRATVLTLSGRYVAEARPGAGDRLDKPGWRLLSAVIECEGGPLFVKCVGPRATLDRAEPAFRAWVRSFRRRG